eukprot:564553-Amphidinium_carterae.2
MRQSWIELPPCSQATTSLRRRVSAGTCHEYTSNAACDASTNRSLMTRFLKTLRGLLLRCTTS